MGDGEFVNSTKTVSSSAEIKLSSVFNKNKSLDEGMNAFEDCNVCWIDW